MSKNMVVRKDNFIITASYKLTLNEQRLLLTAIAKIPFAKEVPCKITITAQEFLKCFPDIGETNVHKQMKDAIENLWNRSIKIEDPGRKEEFRWISSKINYKKGEGRINFSFSNEIIPYLEHLKTRFTKYNLEDVSNFKSLYSIRLYEMLLQFQSTNIFIINLINFRERLGIMNKYLDYLNLRRRVIEPAINELNEKSHFNVIFKGVKEGKSIKSLEFFFSKKSEN